eukprot:7220102-Pyramimonas_sp.AAC.1
MMRQQLRNKKIHLAGIQEARTPQGSKRNGACQVLASGHINHSAGVELWAKLGEPYGQCNGRPLLFHPRHLSVRIQAPGLEVAVAIAHAYHSGHKVS